MRMLANLKRLDLACHALAAIALFIPATASADCNAQMSAPGPIPTIAYDPFDGVARSENFTVEFVNNGADACTLSVAVKSQMAGSTRYFKNGTDQLLYVVELPDGTNFPNNIASPLGSFALPGGAGKTKMVTLKIKVPAGLIAPARTYTDLMTFRTFKAGTSTQLGPDRTASGSATVEARAQLNIAGASSSHFGSFGVDEIDFDALATGKTRIAIVQVRATDDVSITVSSQNTGKLRHKVLTSDPGVPYTMLLDGTSMSLTVPSSINRTLPLSLDGARYPMVLTVGDVTGRPAGNYKDTLTITVSP